MSFLNDLKKSLSGAADYTVKKTGEVTGTARIRMDIRSCKARLSKCFESIGRTYYKEQKGLIENGTDAIAAYIAEADSIKAEITALQAQLAALQGCILCPSCGAQISDKSVFCPLCGVKLPVKADEKAPDVEADKENSSEETKTESETELQDEEQTEL